MATAPCSFRRIEIVLSRIQHRGQYAQAGIELTASFDGRFVTSAFGELDTLVPAYAATIHKSQGSEYPRSLSLS